MAVYSDAISRSPRKSVCRSEGASNVAMGGRVAIVMLTTDANKGTGRGFRGTFTSTGMCLATDVLETDLCADCIPFSIIIICPCIPQIKYVPC